MRSSSSTPTVLRPRATTRPCARSPSSPPPSRPRRNVISRRTGQGRAFLDTTRAAWPSPALARLDAIWGGAVALPIAVAVASAGHGLPLAPALGAYLHAFTANLISAGVRLIPLGQTDGQRLLAAFEGLVTATAERALAVPLEEVGSASFRADLAGMHHETQYTRLFRS